MNIPLRRDWYLHLDRIEPLSPIDVSRDEFHRMIWSERQEDIARTFMMNVSSLNSICKRHDIPVPKRGDWRRVASGKQVAITPLPDAGPDTSETIRFKHTPLRVIGFSVDHEEIATLISRESLAENRISFRKSTDFHPLILELEKSLNKNRIDNEQLAYAFLGKSVPKAIEVHAKTAGVHWSVRILDALITALIERNILDLKMRGKKKLDSISVLGVPISIQVDEKVRRQLEVDGEVRITTRKKGRLLPCGPLSLTISSSEWPEVSLTWSDGPGSTLERHLNSMVVGILRIVDRVLAQDKSKNTERLNAMTVERRPVQNPSCSDEFETLVKRWNTARRIESFLKDVRERGLKPEFLKSFDSTEDVEEWAERYLDSIDPLCDSERSIGFLGKGKFGEDDLD